MYDPNKPIMLPIDEETPEDLEKELLKEYYKKLAITKGARPPFLNTGKISGMTLTPAGFDAKDLFDNISDEELLEVMLAAKKPK